MLFPPELPAAPTWVLELWGRTARVEGFPRLSRPRVPSVPVRWMEDEEDFSREVKKEEEGEELRGVEGRGWDC